MLKKTVLKTIFLSAAISIFLLGISITNIYNLNQDASLNIVNNAHAQEPSWWNADWKYRKKVIISEKSGSDLEGQQILVSLSAANFDFNNAKENGGDIRFTRSNGSSLESFWINSWNKSSQEAKIWVKASSIPKNATADLYMYYGNDAAGSASDGDATFEFFDDFSQNPNTSGRWATHRFSDDIENEGGWDKANCAWYLTKPYPSKAFAALANYSLTQKSWKANFWFLAGGGNGGDGMVFLFYKDGNAYGTPNIGGWLGFGTVDGNIPGYGVEFDGFKNSYDPSGQHIAITQNDSITHLSYIDNPLVKDNIWHEANILYSKGQVTINIDNSDLLKYTIENPDYTYKGIGFSSSNGGLNDNHVITDFNIQKYAAANPAVAIEKEEKGKSAPANGAAGSVGGIVFFDTNNNGIYDLGEKGIKDVALKLYEDTDGNIELNYSADKLVDTKITEDNGRYKFAGLLPNSYILDIDLSTVPENYKNTTENEPLFIILNKKVDADAINFGYAPSAIAPATEAISEIELVPQSIKPAKEITPESTKEQSASSPIRPKNILNHLISAETVSNILTIAIPDSIADRYIDNVCNNEVLQNINGVTIILATTAGTVSFLPFAAFTIPYLRYLLQFITSPLTILRIRRRKEWGTVYNAFTKQPIDLAIVRLWNSETNKAAGTKVTDSEGRYLFIIKPGGKYYLTAEKPDYSFPSKYLENINSDKDFSNIYHKEILSLLDEKSDKKYFLIKDKPREKTKLLKQPSVTVNIPLDPKEGIAVAANAKALPFKTKVKTLSDSFKKTAGEITKDTSSFFDLLKKTKFGSILAISGIGIAFLNFIISLSLLTFFLLILQTFFYILFRRITIGSKSKSWGKVFDLENKNTIPGAVVRIFDTKFKKLLSAYTTASDGKYGFLVGKDKYIITCEKEGYTFPKKQVIIDGKEIKTVSRDLEMEKSSIDINTALTRQRLNALVSSLRNELADNPNIFSKLIFSLFFKKKGYAFPVGKKTEKKINNKKLKKPSAPDTIAKTEEEILLAEKREKKNIESLRKELEERPGIISSLMYKYLYKRQKREKDAKKSKPKKIKQPPGRE